MIARGIQFARRWRLAHESSKLGPEFGLHGIRPVGIDASRERRPESPSVAAKRAVYVIDKALLANCGTTQPARIIMGQDIEQHAPHERFPCARGRALGDITQGTLR